MRQHTFNSLQSKHSGFLGLIVVVVLGICTAPFATTPYFFVKSKSIKLDGNTTITIQINNLSPEIKTLKFRVSSDVTVKEASVNISQLSNISPGKWQYTWQGLIPMGVIQIRLMDEKGADLGKPKKEIINLLSAEGPHTYKSKAFSESPQPKAAVAKPYNLTLKDIRGVQTVFIVVAEKSTGRTLFQYLGAPKLDFSFDAAGEHLLLLVKGYRDDGSDVDPLYTLKQKE